MAVAYSARSAAVEITNAEQKSLGRGVYRLHSEQRGTKDRGLLDTVLTITPSGPGYSVSSSDPPLTSSGTLQGDGTLAVDGGLQPIVESYNQLLSALTGMDGGHSSVHLNIGKNRVNVPVTVVTSVTDDKTTSLIFRGQTDTSITTAHIHVVVEIHATLSSGHVSAATANNDVTASLPFRSIRVEQSWSLTRYPQSGDSGQVANDQGVSDPVSAMARLIDQRGE